MSRSLLEKSEDVPDRRNYTKAKGGDRALGNAGGGLAIVHKGYITVTGDRAARHVWTWM